MGKSGTVKINNQDLIFAYNLPFFQSWATVSNAGLPVQKIS
jgi:hypothetical protein